MPDLAELVVCRFDDFLLDAQAGTLTRLRPDGQYERAVQLDPSSAETLAGLAEALLESVPYWSTDDPTAPAKFRRAEQLIGQAELLRPDNLRVMLARVFLLLRQARCPELIPFAQRASEAHPLLSSLYVSQGVCLLFAGRAAEAVARFKQAIGCAGEPGVS
jgi:predicted Zn-dependent protease